MMTRLGIRQRIVTNQPNKASIAESNIRVMKRLVVITVLAISNKKFHVF